MTRRPVVETTAGWVEGVVLERGGRAVRAFLGVPYAAAPVGERRFRAPEPVEGWTGVRDASEPGPAAPQPLDSPMQRLVPGGAPRRYDEAGCLTVNVWAPEAASGAPVMVSVHGGSFLIGANGQETYDGSVLAAEGQVVVVAPNYRLGALGFLVAPDVQPNCGLLDLVLALRWVRDNAASFGGDPGNVTMFGISAGGGGTRHLLASPHASGLVHRAIIQSGCTHLTLSADQAAEIGERVVAELGTPDRLRSASVEELLDAQTAAQRELLGTVGMMPFHPCVDGDVVTAYPRQAFASGMAAGVTTIIGTTRDEMRMFLDADAHQLDDARLHKRTLQYLRRQGVAGAEAGAQRLLEVYAKTGHGGPGDTWADLLTDGEMRVPAWRDLEAQVAHQPRTYSYVFTWPAAVYGGAWGACHAVDLPFTYGTLDRAGWAEWTGADRDPDAARALSVRLREAWARFARTGDPGWPAYDLDRRATMILGRESSVEEDPWGDERQAWEEMLP